MEQANERNIRVCLTVERRWQSHLSDARGGKKGSKLYNAMRKYGPDSFTVERIDTAESQAELDAKEQAWIARLGTIGSGYNLRSGGARGKHTEETKAKLRAARLRQSFTAEQKARMANVGAANGMHGRTHSDAARATISEKALKHCKRTADQRAMKMRKAIPPLVDPTGKVHSGIVGLKKFCRDNGLDTKSLGLVISGKHAQTKGWKLYKGATNESESVNE